MFEGILKKYSIQTVGNVTKLDIIMENVTAVSEHRSKSFGHFWPKYSFRMVKIRSKRTKTSKMIHFCPNVLTENVVDFDLWPRRCMKEQGQEGGGVSTLGATIGVLDSLRREGIEL